MKILVIRFGDFSQVLLTTPVIRILKTSLNAKVFYLTNNANAELLAENPYLNQIFDLTHSIAILKKENFDVVIDLQGNLKSRRITFILNKKRFSIKKERFKYWLFANFKLNRLSKEHIVQRFLDVIKPLNVEEDNLGLDFFIPERDEVEKSWLPETHQNGYAAVCIGGKYSTRRLPKNRLIELCDRINKPIVLVGNKNDSETAVEIEAFFKQGTIDEEKEIEELNKKAVIFNACGKFNFNQLASLLKNANWVFTHDNEMMHVAAALKKQIYSIWGNTVPEFGKYPYRTQFTIFENTKLSCRPCSKEGFSKCPKGHFKCMNDVTFDFYLPD
ncbi:glycosyltransferase family 9 protein [Ekhidna sp.]